MNHIRHTIGLCAVLVLTVGAAANARGTSARSSEGARHPVGARPPAEDIVATPLVLPLREDPRPPTVAADPATVIGDVRVRTDGQGRLLVLVDEWQDWTPPDGIADRAFLFQSETPIADRIDERLPMAGVVFRQTSLYITTPGGGFVLDLAVGADSSTRRETGRRIVLHDGLALQSRIPGTELPVLDPAALEGVTIVAQAGSGSVETMAENCDGGGPGASTCEYSCNMSVQPVTKTDQCGVTCREGYYACCGCNALYNATCKCVKESVKGTGSPSSRIDSF